MPRASLDKNYFQQTTGKITEASPLNFPEGSLLDASNVEIDFTGTLKRRLGIQFEDSFTLDALSNNPNDDLDPSFADTYIWENPKRANGNSILVCVFVDTRESDGITRVHLAFYDLNKRPISANRIDVITIEQEVIDYTPRVQLVEAKGFLFVATGIGDPIYIDYFPGESLGNIFQINEIEFFLRDTIGANANGFSRSTSLPSDRLYDLINQGWPYDKVPWIDDTAATGVDGFRFPWYNFEYWYGRYPSSNDLYNTYMINGVMSRTAIESSQPSSGTSAKGSFVIPLRRAFTPDDTSMRYTDRVVGLVNNYAFTGGSVDDIDQGPSAIEFFQGHVCFAGALSRKTSLRNAILVSQSLTSVEKAGAIHAVNDPSSDIDSSPLDIDGGVIRLEGVDEIISLKVVGNSLIVFCSNGIWSVSGPLEGLFTVNEVNITKISDEGVDSPGSIVELQSSIMFWGRSGIFALSPQQASSIPQVTDLTESTIQEDYNKLNNFQKAYCKGVSDPKARKVYWMYNNSITSDEDRFYNHDTILIFDARSQGFYYYNIENSDQGPYLMSAFVSDSLSQSVELENVVVGQDVVQVGSEDVTINRTISEAQVSNDLYFWGLAYNDPEDERLSADFFAQFLNEGFEDWSTSPVGGAQDYTSYLETGHEIVGDTMRNKQATYVFCYFNRTEEEFVDNGQGGLEFDRPSSCYMQTKWDWTDSGTANRWTAPAQVYRFRRNYIPALGPFNYDFDVIETKNKVRGKGKSLRVRFESESGKDFQLLGWATSYTAGQTP
tara:strand:- start:4664 stop:6994 length:2331 start_codon:yes stop_codon:yes gene_type:complete